MTTTPTTIDTPAKPFLRRIAQRLARMGGLHRPSSAADDRRHLAEQFSIDARRMHNQPFPRSPH